MSEVLYLKKANTPPEDYFQATPALLERAMTLKDLFPYDPVKKQFIGLSVGSGAESIVSAAADEAMVLGTKALNDANEQGKMRTGPDEPLDANRVALIKMAIDEINDEKGWTKPTGNLPAMPRVNVLTEIVGFEVTGEEREAAHKEWLEDQAKKSGETA